MITNINVNKLIKVNCFVFYNRLKIFCDNKKKMNEKNKEYNSGKVHYISDTNKYSDMVN